MRINEQNKTMDMEARDINYILPAYLRSYQFHSKNELPTKIIFPMFPSVKAANGVDIPIEYVPPLDKIAVDIAKDGSNVAEITPEQEAALDKKDEEIKNLKAEVAELETIGRGGEERGGTEATKVDGTEKQEPEPSSGQLLDEAADKELEEDTEPEVIPSPLEALDEVETKEKTEARRKEEADKAGKESPARAAFSIDPNPTHQPKPDRKPKQPPGGDIGTGQPLSNMQPRGRDDQKRTARDLLEEPEIEGTPEKEFGKEIKRDKKGKPVVEDKE